MPGKTQRKRHVQLTLESARRPDGRRGGWRPGAGRKRIANAVSHDTRGDVSSNHPSHVTLRALEDAPFLASDHLIRHIHGVIAGSQKPDFRIVEFNVLGNHVHLITESADKDAQSRGIQGFAVRFARRVNRVLGREGRLFAQRYHARALETPREVRNALRYVLMNRKHHRSGRFQKNWIDPWSSAAWFTGWSRPIVVDSDWKRTLLLLPRPTANATTWLLKTGWKRWGLLDFDERPA